MRVRDKQPCLGQEFVWMHISPVSLFLFVLSLSRVSVGVIIKKRGKDQVPVAPAQCGKVWNMDIQDRRLLSFTGAAPAFATTRYVRFCECE
jgi:hypothetical protein